MKRLVLNAGWRYLSIALQFGVVIVVSNGLPPEGTAVFLSLFGVAQVAYVVAGAGLPDGAIRHAEVLQVSEGSAAKSVYLWRAWKISLLVTAGMALLMVIPVAALGPLAWAALVWALGYSACFLSSQFTLSIGRRDSATFMLYGSIAVATATVVALMFALSTPSAEEVVFGAAWAAAAVGVVCVGTTHVYLLKGRRGHSSELPTNWLRDSWRTGISIAGGRLAMAGLLWTPIWVASLILAPVEAANVALAMRLAIAVSALLAVVKFSVRPELAALAAEHRWAAMTSLGSRIAGIATAFALLATVAIAVSGWWLLPAVFGSPYRMAWAILLILMVGVVVEGMCGPLDEALKMSGLAGFVVVIHASAFSLAVLGESTTALVFDSPYLLAATHVLVVCAYCVLLARRYAALAGQLILPRWRTSHV